MLRPFRLLEPSTLAEASAELGRLGDGAKVYAGGAELVLLMREGLLRPDYLVGVKRIPELAGLTWEGDLLRIGATVTHRRLETDPLVHERLPMLSKCESQIGNIRVRVQGTLGGNLCFADPHADPGTALLVHEATVTVAGGNGARALPLEEFLVGTYETALEPDELLVEVQSRPLPAGWGWAYERVERFHRPTLNLAVAAHANAGVLEEVRMAVGCVGPRPLRLRALEVALRGMPLEEGLRQVRGVRSYLEELLEPVDDLLGSAEYKVHVVGVLLGRALAEAAANGNGGMHDA
jgi:aerobic carbon-monoxide dehydrogenase medium subunit